MRRKILSVQSQAFVNEPVHLMSPEQFAAAVADRLPQAVNAMRRFFPVDGPARSRVRGVYSAAGEGRYPNGVTDVVLELFMAAHPSTHVQPNHISAGAMLEML